MQLNSNGRTITLNEDQIKALQAIDNWYRGPELFFTLSGPAGSGKTTICKKAIEKFRKPVCISAPTHKACKVVAKSTGLRSVTIQSLCGLRPDTNLEDVNEKNFTQQAEPKIKDYNAVLIDEASMLNNLVYNKEREEWEPTGILSLIIRLAKESSTKVLFMGDVYQLPPVNEMVSEVFTHPEINLVQLTKVERQQGSNPLMGVFDAIRSRIDAEDDVFDHVTQVIQNDAGEDQGVVFFKHGEEFFKKVMEAFGSQEFLDNPNFAKLLAFKNTAVKAWNSYIRQTIYNNTPEAIVKGEVLMSYTHLYDQNLGRNLITNSAEYKINSVNKKSINWAGSNIEVYETTMEDVDDMFGIKVPINIVVPGVKNYNTFLQCWHPLKENAIRFKQWSSYYKFKNQFMLIEELRDTENKLILKKDFDYAYALTTHKSQGSTYRNVFVFEDDIDTCQTRIVANKLKYVALSRPTHMAYSLSQKTVEHERSNLSTAELSV
jgi:hypothetical protein